MDTTSKFKNSGTSAGKTGNNVSAQFFVFNGLDYVGNDSFSKERVSIGRSDEADIRLSDPSIADIHAYVYFKDNQVIVSNQNPNNGLRLNGKSIKLAFMNPLDVLDIGPYSLKVKVNQEEAEKKADTSVPQAAVIRDDEEEEDGVYEIYRPKPVETSPEQSVGQKEIDLKTSIPDSPAASTTSSSVEKQDFSSSEIQKELDILEIEEAIEEKFYQVVFDGKIKEGASPQKVIKNLAELFNTQESRIRKLFVNGSVVLKRNLAYKDAKKIKHAFDMSGALCTLREMGAIEAEPAAVKVDTPPPSIETDAATTDALADEEVAAPVAPKEGLKPSGASATAAGRYIDVDDDEDEDEDDFEPSWSLKEKLMAAPHGKGAVRTRSQGSEQRVEIIKFRKDDVEDIRYLDAKSKFKVKNRKFALTLAEYKSNDRRYFYFYDHFSGEMLGDDSRAASLDTLKTESHLFRRRKGLYRCRIPETGRVVLNDGINEYLIRSVTETKRPEVRDIPVKKSFTWRHWTTSVVFHLVFFLFLGIIPFFTGEEEKGPEVRFVKIDQRQLAQLDQSLKPKPKPKPEPPKPKEKPPVVKPKKEPVKAKKKEKPVKKKPKPTVAKAKKSTSKKKTQAVSSQHPDAGGGFGKGNVVNRDINQTGILSMIGEGIGATPSTAIAAVTNLDAVASPGAGDKNFKVGGVKGKLGNGKISVTSNTAVVQTKGSKQVLRSAGASGKGRVAALEKGDVGRKQVKGMVVKAHLTKAVKIRGGMSREAVKRVIDQHMDEVYFCYETALLANPSIMGRMVYEWKIMMDGSVGEVNIKSSSVNSHEMHACIKGAIKTWRFPSPSGTEVVVSYPFVFDIVGF